MMADPYAPGNWRYMEQESQTDEPGGAFLMTWFRVLEGDEGEEVHDEVRLMRLPSWDGFRVGMHTAPARAAKNIERQHRTTNLVTSGEFEQLHEAVEFADDYMAAEQAE